MYQFVRVLIDAGTLPGLVSRFSSHQLRSGFPFQKLRPGNWNSNVILLAFANSELLLAYL